MVTRRFLDCEGVTMANTDKLSHDEYIVAVLNEAREIWGVTIAELARRSGIAELRLGNILRGERRLHGDELARLMVIMNIPIRKICPIYYIPRTTLASGKSVFGMQEDGKGK